LHGAALAGRAAHHRRPPIPAGVQPPGDERRPPAPAGRPRPGAARPARARIRGAAGELPAAAACGPHAGPATPLVPRRDPEPARPDAGGHATRPDVAFLPSGPASPDQPRGGDDGRHRVERPPGSLTAGPMRLYSREELDRVPWPDTPDGDYARR